MPRRLGRCTLLYYHIHHNNPMNSTIAQLLPIPDAYDRRARLLPAAVFAVLPALGLGLSLGELVPGTGQALLGTSGFFAVLMVTAAVVRARGRAAQHGLFSRWGGAPTLRFLRLRDTTIDDLTTRRYHTFLKDRVNGFEPPTSVEVEERDPAAADKQYTSAVSWLREFTRNHDRFPRVAQENANYGLHRNLFALQPWGTIVAVLGVVGSIAWGWIDSGGSFEHLAAEPIVLGLASLLFLLAWRAWITEAFVREAADAYALALLGSCENAEPTDRKE